MKRNDFLNEIRKEISPETKIFVQHYADIVIRVNQLLAEKGWTQKTLAEKMGKKPSEISKWLKGNHNFTLKSIAKLEVELGESIIHIPTQKSFVGNDGTEVLMTVHRYRPSNISSNFQKLNTKTSRTKENIVA